MTNMFPHLRIMYMIKMVEDKKKNQPNINKKHHITSYSKLF